MARFATKDQILTSTGVVECPHCASMLCHRVARDGYADLYEEVLDLPLALQDLPSTILGMETKLYSSESSFGSMIWRRHALFTLWESSC